MKCRILKWTGTGCCVIFACSALLLSGCCSTGKNEFETVAGHLESGGSYYRISNNSELFDLCGKSFRSVENSLLEGGDFAENEKKMLVCALYELIFRRLGVSECQWSGASSVRIPDAVEQTYRNRTFYYLPENAAGLLWQLPGKKNRSLFKELKDLPADTVFAGDFFLDLRSLRSALEQSKILSPNAESICRAVFKVGLDELFNCMSGEWGFVVFPDESREGKLHFVITFPDRKNRVFSALSEFVKKLPDGKSSGNTASLYLADMGGEASCFSSAECLTIFSSEQAKQKFLFSNTRLASQPEFKRLTTGLPDDGMAVFYSAGTRVETRQVALPPLLGGGKIDLSELDRPALSVIRREKNGIAVISNSGFDIPAGNVSEFLLKPALVLASHWNWIVSLMPQTGKAEKKLVPQKQKMSATKKELRNLCGKNVKKIAEALKKYAQKYKEYPADMNLGGIRLLLKEKLIKGADLICPATGAQAFAGAEVPEVFNCSYVYFGKWNRGAHGKLPLLIDRPGNHGDDFYVLFNDGSVELMRIDNCTSVKRIAGFLHTKYKFSEEDFRSLINRASLLDAELEAR